MSGTDAVPFRRPEGRCGLCAAEAVGWRWVDRVKARPGRWVPVCGDHYRRRDVPGDRPTAGRGAP